MSDRPLFVDPGRFRAGLSITRGNVGFLENRMTAQGPLFA
jgi:hypothetical protein